MITRQSLEAFAPKPRDKGKAEIWENYLSAIMEAQEAGLFTEHKIDTPARFQHLMAQWAWETGGFTILWESLYYTSTSAIRRAWSSRAQKHSDAWIRANLLRNPIALGDWAYGGRMGNAKGIRPDGGCDGHDYRGFGIQQITGKTDHKRWLGDDYSVLNALRAGLQEWTKKGCNEHADKDDVRRVTRLINGGYNGLDGRIAWLKKAKSKLDGIAPEHLAPASHEAIHEKQVDKEEVPIAPEPEPVQPAPEPVEEKPVARKEKPSRDDLARKSKSASALQRFINWVKVTFFGTATISFADITGTGGSNVKIFMEMVNKNGLVVLAVLAVGLAAGVALAWWLIDRRRQEYVEGRYVPSGEA